MTVSGFVVLGEKNILTLFMVMVGGALVQYCGYFIERGPLAIDSDWSFANTGNNKKDDDRTKQNKELSKINRTRWWVPYFTIGGLLQLGITMTVLIGTVTFKEKDNTQGVTTSAVYYTIYFLLFPMLALYDVAKRSKVNFINVDKTYILLSFTSKIALFFIVICGTFHNLHKVKDSDIDVNEQMWEDYGIIFGQVIPIVTCVIGLYALLWRQDEVVEDNETNVFINPTYTKGPNIAELKESRYTQVLKLIW